MTIKTPPKAWDRHAQVVARSIAGMDATRLPGKKTQLTAIIHEAIVDAMMMAAENVEPSVGVTIERASIRLNGVNVSDDEMEVLRRIADRVKPRVCTKTQTGEVASC